MSDCQTTHERLPLLRYGNELTADERCEVLAHLEECSDCRSVRDQVEATAASLDAVPLERPATKRLLGLKHRVLQQVGAGCREEGALLVRGELEPDEQARLETHLSDCAECQASLRDFDRVGEALDLVPLELPAAGLQTLRQRVLDRVGSRPRRPRGLVIRMLLPIAAAAAVLIVAWLSLDALRPVGLLPAQLTAIKQGADELLRGNRKDEAVRVYRLLLEQEALNASPEARRVLASAQRTLDAIERLERARSSQDTELLITYYPDSPVVPPALAQLAAQKSSEPRVTPGVQEQPLVNLDPIAISDLRLSPEVRAVVSNSPAMQQVVLLQQGLRYEDLGQLASARETFEQVIVLDPATAAARAARAGLIRLG